MSLTATRSVIGRWLLAGVLPLVLVAAAGAAETPTSSGEASRVEIPLFRIPFMKTPPKIDGIMEEGEWEDSSALSCFWYWAFPGGHYDFMAPFETQLQVYMAYDKDNLYMAWSSPVFPTGSWLRARGRFPKVIEHPLYGIYRDDYVGWGFRPYFDDVKTFRMGGFGWFVNPTSVVGDGGPAFEPDGGAKWKSDIVTRSNVTGSRWVQEMAIPLKNMVCGPYAGKDENGAEILSLPIADGTQWLFRLDRCSGEWGNRGFHNKFFDGTSRLIFDSSCVSVQVNELGPIMEDVVDVQLTLKNHSSRSETVQLGFFVESAEGNIYSSYADKQLKDGLVELVPGEVRKLRLRKPLPGITVNGNVLWFDVRAAGKVAKPIFRTRLVTFHSQDKPNFKSFHIAGIAMNRPPRKDFDVRLDFSPHTNKISVVLDTGVYGSTEAARTAVEAKLTVTDPNDEDKEVLSQTAKFSGAFACFLSDMPKLRANQEYKVSVLLMDRNMRIVGEENTTFVNKVEEWMGNKIGLDDVVWEPFTAIEARPNGLETLKHRITLDASGLPAQIDIKADPRELPLELRGPAAKPTNEQLLAIGRGPQLRAPLRLQAIIDGKAVPATVVSPAKLVRQWKSEFEYAAKLKVGPLDVDLVTQYDCDGAMTARMTYGSGGPAEIDGLEMLMDVEGPMDLKASPTAKGVIWDSAKTDMELYYSHFVPWFRFGSNERAFAWICDNEKPWMLDRNGSAMTLERNDANEITWRVKFVNHRRNVQGQRTIEFMVLTSPSKPRPVNYRQYAWLYRSDIWAREYMMNVCLLPESIAKMNEGGQTLYGDRWVPYKDGNDYLRRDRKTAVNAPDDLPEDKYDTYRSETGPWNRYGLCRNNGVHTLLDRYFEDKMVYYMERQIRVGRRCGFWWDEYWPMHSQATVSDKLATGDAYMRDPNDVKENELPWHRGFLHMYMRETLKRLARTFAVNHLPQRNGIWANEAGIAFESFAWDTNLVEWAGSDHNSYDLDSVVCYSAADMRGFRQNHTGLVSRILPGYGGKKFPPQPGDDKKFDRQYLGRGLLYDVGVSFDGPHGTIRHPDEGVRLLNTLLNFGYFDEPNCEYLPYWRNQAWVRYGPDFPPDANYTVFTEPPERRVFVTVYRHPCEVNGRKGTAAILVVMNESETPVRADLRVLDPKRLFGGPNGLTLGEVIDDLKKADPAQAAMLDQWGQGSGQIVLKDLDDGRYVALSSGGQNAGGAVKEADVPSAANGTKAGAGGGEVYGPLYVRPHDYRILYGRWLEGQK